MQKTDYIWHNGKMVAWDDAKIHVLAHSLHYGGAAFEGIRMYQTDQGTAIFRLQDHLNRLAYSANAINMELPFSLQELAAACIEVVRINKLPQGYIRPIAYYGYGKMGVNPVGAPAEVAIACWPWGAYLPHDMVNIQTSKYIRFPARSTITDAKLSGHYLNGILAIIALQGTDYHEALFLDEEGYIAEGAGENIFFVKDNVIYTPALGAILAGITRSTIIELATNLGYQIVEKQIMLDEAYKADEAFFTGTAAEVTPIKSIDDNLIGDGELGPVTERIKQNYLDIVYARNKAYGHYLTYV